MLLLSLNPTFFLPSNFTVRPFRGSSFHPHHIAPGLPVGMISSSHSQQVAAAAREKVNSQKMIGRTMLSNLHVREFGPLPPGGKSEESILCVCVWCKWLWWAILKRFFLSPEHLR